jgi:hypothetical protein
MSALKLFANFPTTKAEIMECIASAKSEILSGDFDPLEIDLHLKKLEELVKGIREDKEVKAVVFSELEKYVEKSVRRFGCEIQKRLLTEWDYSLTGDSELFQLEAKAKIINEQIKDRKQFLQLVPDNGIVNPETGELIYKAESKSKDSFAIKIL